MVAIITIRRASPTPFWVSDTALRSSPPPDLIEDSRAAPEWRRHHAQ